jgi:branched-chain amino acid aminotransferase
VKAAADAEKEGFHQILWLFGDNDEITEVGAMNIFLFMVNKETGRKELVTPPLTRGDILPGVTRDSIVQLAKTFEDVDVVERFPTMSELVEASDDGRLLEVFGAGTAAVVSPISCIRYKGQDITIPAVGDMTKKVWNKLTGIQYGKIEGPSGWSIKC